MARDDAYFPDFGFTGFLNSSSYVSHALVYLPFILPLSFRGFTVLLS